jgi:hypothetical protein
VIIVLVRLDIGLFHDVPFELFQSWACARGATARTTAATTASRR